MENEPKIEARESAVDRCRAKLVELANKVNDNDIVNYFNEIDVMGKKLLDKYPDARRYSLYHVLVGSTPNKEIEPIEHEDFPKEDSVATFIEELEKKYGKG